MAECLEEAGYDVMTAADGPQAMALLRSHGPIFSALLSDFHLPGGLTGLDLAAAVRAMSPGLPVVLATGRPDILDTMHGQAGGFVLLHKPYGPAEMLAVLGKLVRPHHPTA